MSTRDTASANQGDIAAAEAADRRAADASPAKSKLKDADQPDDKLLRGWLDIDEYFGGGSVPPETTAGVMSRLLIGTEKAT